MKNIFKFRFDLFDGEGGADSSSGASGLGAEASAFLASLGGGAREEVQKESNDEPITLYGREAREESGESSPVGEDTEANTQQNTKSAAEEFAELIGRGGKYHDEYGQAVSQAIQQRFKNQADLQSTMGSYDSVLAPMYQRYGIKPGDIEALGTAIENDEELYAGEAEKEGLTVEQYRRNLRLQADAERGRQIQKAYEVEQERNQRYEAWDREADELKQSFPNFDLGMEIQTNDKFANLIDNGVSVTDAFFATHAKDILSGLHNESAETAKKDVISSIQQRAARPPENGIRHNAAVVRKVDPKTFTDEDMDKILRDVANGKPFVL